MHSKNNAMHLYAPTLTQWFYDTNRALKEYNNN